jgi:hypothetical protein
MPADLVPHSAIPQLAARVSPELLDVLRQIQRAGFIMNGRDVGEKTVAMLRQLAEFGLVDTGYEGDRVERPYM